MAFVWGHDVFRNLGHELDRIRNMLETEMPGPLACLGVLPI